VSRGDERIEGHVEGESAHEVARVIAEMLGGSGRTGVSISVSDSTIGVLNTGEIEDVKSISASVTTLRASGNTGIAEALGHLTEAAAASQELSPEQRSDLLQQLDEMSRQATIHPEQRAKPGAVRAVLAAVATTFGAAGGLAEVWSTWGPAVKTFFGL